MSIRIERWDRDDPPEAELLKARMEAEGYHTHIWSDDAGTIYETHDHAEDQSHWVISGTIELRVDNETYFLHPGDRDYLPARMKHSAHIPEDQDAVYLIGVKR